jgi:hypothetical protein
MRALRRWYIRISSATKGASADAKVWPASRPMKNIGSASARPIASNRAADRCCCLVISDRTLRISDAFCRTRSQCGDSRQRP